MRDSFGWKSYHLIVARIARQALPQSGQGDPFDGEPLVLRNAGLTLSNQGCSQARAGGPVGKNYSVSVIPVLFT